ncbi:hypothetical protein [Cryobacterium sp. N19]|uniref:hypothetical protein n=1 Tax=Cryobacterium sp. N19 TaxID=2048288 RepID=UPI001E4A21A1|nr:hypothetical protein [Cryobacterium sp. N19]
MDDGSPRWADRDAQRWGRIAAVVAAVGDALASRAWTPQAGSEIFGDVEVPGYPGDLTQTEQKIVGEWFNYAEAVRVDPWWDQLENGRHRLWRTLPFFGDALVPICGSALGYANAADAIAMGPSWPQTFSTQLHEVNASVAFDATDPVNVNFRRSMEQASAGHFPSPV